MSEGTLTVRTQFEDGRVTANLETPDGPPTGIHIFGSMSAAERYAEVYGLEFIEEGTPDAHD